MDDLKGVPGLAGSFDPLDFTSEPPPGWRHPITGRYDWTPSPALVRFGRYIRRGRYYSHKSQDRLSHECGVSQSMISRAERALAPAMGIDKMVMIGEALGSSLPLGYCPHEHVCPWQALPHASRPTEASTEFDYGLTPALLEASRSLNRSLGD